MLWLVWEIWDWEVCKTGHNYIIVMFASIHVRQMVYTQRWTITQNWTHSFTYTCNPGTVVQRLQRLPGSCLNRKSPPPAVCADSQWSEISLLGKLVSMETRGSGVMMLLVEQQPWINHGFQHTQNVISSPEVCVYGGIFSSCTVWNLAAKWKESDGDSWLCGTWALTWGIWAFKEDSRWCLRGVWVNKGADVLFCWGVAERY